ncbi:hypothetical protein RDABS01_010088 [Bienertia sinuspersici]
MRGPDGGVIRVAGAHLKQDLDVNIVEAKAVILGLKLALQAGENNIIMVSDCLHVINLINKNIVHRSYLGVFIKEALELSNSFESVSFVHVFREANRVAHTMAYIMPLDEFTRVWIGEYPMELDDVLAEDIC